MAHADERARKGNGNDSDNARTFGADADDVANTEGRLEEIMDTLEGLIEFKKGIESKAEESRVGKLSSAGMAREEAQKARGELAGSDSHNRGWRTVVYVDAVRAADRAAAEEAEAERSHQEYLATCPREERVAEMLKERLGAEEAALILEAISSAGRAERKRVVAKALKIASAAALGGVAYSGLIALLVNAARPKTLRAKVASKALRWAFR